MKNSLLAAKASTRAKERDIKVVLFYFCAPFTPTILKTS